MAPPPKFRRGRNCGGQKLRSTLKVSRRRHRRHNHKYKLRANAGALQSQNFLISGFLNVDGLTDASLADVASFASRISPDIFVLLETKRRTEDIDSDISIDGYEHTEIRRSDLAGDKSGGGIAFYTKTSGGVLFKRHTPNIAHKDLEYVQSERFWVTVESQQGKTAICSAYLGCQFSDNRNHDWNSGIYWVLREESVALRSAGYRLQFLGDYNGHVGNRLGQGVPGNNGDINPNGEKFLEFLLACDLRHVNGELRTPGDPETKICSGTWTRQRGNSRSIIDFIGVSAEHMGSVVEMNVDDTGSYGGGSDHNWCWMKMTDKFRLLVPRQQVKKSKRDFKINDDQDWSQYKQIVHDNLPVDGVDGIGIDQLANVLVSSFQKGGEEALGYKQQTFRSSMRSRSLPSHMVSEIQLKSNMEKEWKTLSSSNNSTADAIAAAESAFNDQKAVVDSLFDVRRLKRRGEDIKKCSGKTPSARKNFWSVVTGKVKQTCDIPTVLSSSGVLKCDPDEIRIEVEKHLCSVYQGSMENVVLSPDLGDTPNDHSYSSSSVNVPAEHNYATNLNPRLRNCGSSEDLSRNPSNWLGREFTVKELKKIAATLNGGKARGWDMIPNEFITHAPDSAFDLMTLLFNKIKNSGVFPRGWNCGRISLIHKKGLRALLGNYRPITVLISMSGFYSKVLNDRLIEVVETNNLLGEIQNGFRKTRCGADNIFLLNTVLWKAKALRKKVHLGFVDVSKAYDSVNRKILWRILKSLGIGGSFLETLKSMYSDDSVRCTVNGVTTQSVFLRRGLRQGCSLSPLLFALYISGLGEELASVDEGFKVGDVLVSSLLFADDIVLIARSADGLRRLYKIVKKHCDGLLLDINTGEGKSEVVSPEVDETWDILNDEGVVELSLRQVLRYKYLGLETSPSIYRTCFEKQGKCKKIANKYKFACLYLGGRGADVVDVSLATWCNIAIPSILFGTESIVFKECNILAIEAVQSKVAKSILGVPANTVGLCAQTELGLFPFRTLLYKKQLAFYFRVLSLPNSRWVKQALLEHLSLAWPSPYLSNIVAIRESVQLRIVPPTVRYLHVHLAQWSLSETNFAMSQKSLPYVRPLAFYRRQPYVYEHEHLSTIAEFRLSNAGLGNRFPRFPAGMFNRVTSCPLCPSPTLTEAHVVFFCSAVERFREELDLKFFRNICARKGFSEIKTFLLFVNGYDWNELSAAVTKDFIARGLAMDTIRGHWLARW